jgi:ecotin
VYRKSFGRKGLLVGLLLCATAVRGDKNGMQPYPAAEEGFERMVFRIPPVQDEATRKVEIIVGKTLLVDCNQQWYGGDLHERVVEGWGYSYLVLEKVGGPASTRMACPPGEEKREAFVAVRGHGFLQRYNSKLPFVVYVPKGFEVRYRIWVAGNEIGRARPE